MDADGCLEELTPTRLWQLRQPGSEMPPSPACPPATAPSAPRPPRPVPATGAERRGGGHRRRGTPAPSPPASPAGPRLGRGAGAAFLSPPGQKLEGLFEFLFFILLIFIFCTKPAIVNTFEEKK